MDAPPSLPFSSSLLSSLLLERVFFFQFLVCVLCSGRERQLGERQSFASCLLAFALFNKSYIVYLHKQKPCIIISCLHQHSTPSSLHFYFSFFFPSLTGQVMACGAHHLAFNYSTQTQLSLDQIWSKFGQLDFDFLNSLVSLIKHVISLNYLINTNLNLVT